MPSRTAIEKRRERKVALTNLSLRDFFELVNNGTVPRRAPRLRLLLVPIAEALLKHSHAGTSPDVATAPLKSAYERLRKARDAAMLRVPLSPLDILTIEQFSLVRLFFVGEWAAWRCIGRCLTCQRYFFATDDRRNYCCPKHRQSRMPAAIKTRVTKHRVSKSL